ncbi:hypothetical protein LV779_26320 [Streptomyces thinghirensis]|nr:hypothetical protein [Streptomyces thinghirensis]
MQANPHMKYYDGRRGYVRVNSTARPPASTSGRSPPSARPALPSARPRPSSPRRAPRAEPRLNPARRARPRAAHRLPRPP